MVMNIDDIDLLSSPVLHATPETKSDLDFIDNQRNNLATSSANIRKLDASITGQPIPSWNATTMSVIDTMDDVAPSDVVTTHIKPEETEMNYEPAIFSPADKISDDTSEEESAVTPYSAVSVTRHINVTPKKLLDTTPEENETNHMTPVTPSPPRHHSSITSDGSEQPKIKTTDPNKLPPLATVSNNSFSLSSASYTPLDIPKTETDQNDCLFISDESSDPSASSNLFLELTEIDSLQQLADTTTQTNISHNYIERLLWEKHYLQYNLSVSQYSLPSLTHTITTLDNELRQLKTTLREALHADIMGNTVLLHHLSVSFDLEIPTLSLFQIDYFSSHSDILTTFISYIMGRLFHNLNVLSSYYLTGTNEIYSKASEASKVISSLLVTDFLSDCRP